MRRRKWTGGETEGGEIPDSNGRRLSRWLRVPVSRQLPLLRWSVCVHVGDGPHPAEVRTRQECGVVPNPSSEQSGTLGSGHVRTETIGRRDRYPDIMNKGEPERGRGRET